MKEKVYEVVSIYDTMSPLYTFKSENAAKEFIKKYLGDSIKYIVQPRERQEAYSSVVDLEMSKKREIEELESQIASLKIEMPFEIKIKKGKDIVLQTKVLMFETASAMGVADAGNGNVFVALPDDYNFTTTFENAMFIRDKVTEMRMDKAILKHKIKEIKEFLGQKKNVSSEDESGEIEIE